MAPYFFAPEDGAKYTLVGPDGSRCVFNDDIDPDAAGMNSSATGLDSPDVNASSNVLVQADGGQNGLYYYGMRPITLNGTIYKFSDIPGRNMQMSKIMQASNAMQADGALTFAPSWRMTNVIGNPSFEGSAVTPWRYYDNSGYATASTATDWADTGTHSGSLTGTTSSGEPFAYLRQDGIPVVGNATYNITAMVNFISGYATLAKPSVFVAWIDKNGSYLGQSADLTALANVGGVQALTGTVTAPDNAATGDFLAGINYTGDYQAFSARYDTILMSRETATYFDGGYTGAYWFGTPGESASGNYVPLFTPFRRQQPLRFTGNWAKDFQILLVSQYAPLFSNQVVSVGPFTAIVVENYGNYPASPIVRIFGTTTSASFTLENLTTGKTVEVDGPTSLGPSDYLDIDILNHNVTLNGTTSWNRYINFATSTWPTIQPNSVNTYEASGTPLMTLTYRHSWI